MTADFLRARVGCSVSLTLGGQHITAFHKLGAILYNVQWMSRKLKELQEKGLYVRDDRYSADMTPPAVWFAYTADRKGIHPQQHLETFSGTLQAMPMADTRRFTKPGG